MRYAEQFDPYYGCRDNVTPAPVKRDRMLLRIDQTDMTLAEIEEFVGWYKARNPEMEVIVDGDSRSLVARDKRMLQGNRDIVLLKIDQIDLSMPEVIDFIEWYQAMNPGMEAFMDGDAYAIVARARC